jgi:hypothetical protein
MVSLLIVRGLFLSHIGTWRGSAAQKVPHRNLETVVPAQNIWLVLVDSCRAYPLDVIKRGDIVHFIGDKIDPIGTPALLSHRMIDSMLVNSGSLASENVSSSRDASKLDPITFDLLADLFLLLVLLDNVLGKLGVERVVSLFWRLGTVGDDS